MLISDDLKNLRNAFLAEGRDIRFVGGCVRDHMANKIPKDIDLCTNATPSEQIEIYKKNNVRWIETGLSHGTLTVMFDHVPYEITSLRVDTDTDGRHATVQFTNDWIADLARRDFTFNAMSLTFDGELVDPFNGLNDLQNGIVRFVGNPNDRIEEDYLRILRWFRFRGRFENFNNESCNVKTSTFDAIMNNIHGLTIISLERIWSELKQIISGPNGSLLLKEIGENHVLTKVSPNLNSVFEEENFANLEHAKKLTTNPVTLLAVLYDSRALDIVHSMKPSAKEFQLAKDICRLLGSPVALKSLVAIHNIDKETAHELGVVKGCDKFDLEMLKSWDVPKFPVSGDNLIALGMKPGPEFSKIINLLKIKWDDSNYTLTGAELLESIIK